MNIPVDLHPCCLETILSYDRTTTAGFVSGVYELDELTGTRKGRVDFYSSFSDLDTSLISYEFNSGVLDMKWDRNYESLACALSDSTLSLLFPVCSVVSENRIKSIALEGEGLFLSVDRSNRVLTSQSGVDVVAVSTQTGSVHLFAVHPTGLQLQATFSKVHELCNESVPAWITSINPHKQTTLLSGGDDCVIRWWDTRSTTGKPVAISRDAHTAGVTSAQWHPHIPHTLATGSYDESILIWDDRQLRSPVKKIETGGGVWRIKWHPEVGLESYLLAACMHGGSAVFDVGSVEQELVDRRVCSFESPNRCVYAIDWLQTERNPFKFRLASSSFYDNVICIWNAEFI